MASNMLAITAIIAFVCGLVPDSNARNCNRNFCDRMRCPLVYSPICGSDGVTYSNNCFMNIENCRRAMKNLPPISKKFEGKCADGDLCKDRTCTENYEPVCGSDGKTYSNTCYLSLANCDLPKDATPVTLAYKGECKVNCDEIACTKEYMAVCGSDGKTYSNKCILSVANCRSEEMGTGSITKVHDGKCVEKPVECPAFCITVYDPVCGSDGVTYSNGCFLGIADCESRKIGGPPITQTTNGACGISSGSLS